MVPIRHKKEPDFSIRDIQTLLAGKDMVQELHRHDFFYMLALKKGAGNHEIDFTPYTVCDNSIFLIRPGQVHKLLLKADSRGYLLQFGNTPLPKINHYQFNTQKFFTILDYIFQEYTDKQEGYQEVIKANMSILFIELTRQQKEHPSGNITLYAQQKLEAFLTLLETHVFNHKQVSAYAAMMNLSTYQLNAITKGTLDKTCSALINEHIILEAKRHLLATSDQINQVADHLGYEDVSYFIRFFKKHTGHSPEAFRYNCR
jgi:AraC family transcriptional activator of pobA